MIKTRVACCVPVIFCIILNVISCKLMWISIISNKFQHVQYWSNCTVWIFCVLSHIYDSFRKCRCRLADTMVNHQKKRGRGSYDSDSAKIRARTGSWHQWRGTWSFQKIQWRRQAVSICKLIRCEWCVTAMQIDKLCQFLIPNSKKIMRICSEYDYLIRNYHSIKYCLKR